MLSNHLILCHPLLLLPSIFCSIRVFSNQWIASLHQVANVLDLHLQHQYFQWIFRVDFLSDWLIWSTCCPRDSQESSLAPQSKGINYSVLSLLYGPTLTSIHDFWKKSQLWLHRPFIGKVMSFAFNAWTMFVIAFLPRNKRLLISWLQSPSTVILEPKKIKSVAASTFSPSICHEVMGLDVRILVFWMLSFKPAFSHSYFNLIKSLQFLFTFCH